MSDIQIFAFSGKSGSGKDFLAEVLRSMLPSTRRCLFVSMADQLKVSAIVEDRLAYQRVYVKKDVESRRALQLRGTELGRDVHGPDIWVRYIRTWLQVHINRGINTFFITDIRFPEEFQAMRSISSDEELKFPQVKLVRVTAPQRTQQRRLQETEGDEEKMRLIASHPSETALDSYAEEAFDYVLHNDPGENAIDMIRNLALSAADQQKHVVFLDLDDTLCECSVHYEAGVSQAHATVTRFIQNTQPNINAELEAMHFTEGFKQHRQNYEKEDFTRDAFAKALVEAARYCLAMCRLENCPMSEELFQELHDIGMDVFNQKFAALPNAVETALWLNSLSSVKVVVVTVGERPDQLRKLWRIGLGSLECQCTFLKSVQAYRNWMHMYPAQRYTMVGDSFARDIEPALAAGVDCAIHIGLHRKSSDLRGHMVAEDLPAAMRFVVI